MINKVPLQTSRRELVGGLTVLIILAGVIISRGGQPDQSLAAPASQFQTMPLVQRPAVESTSSPPVINPVSDRSKNKDANAVAWKSGDSNR